MLRLRSFCLLAAAVLAAGLYSAAPARAADDTSPAAPPRRGMQNPAGEKLRLLLAEKVQK